MNRRLLTIALILVALSMAVALARGVAREALVLPLLALLWGIVQLIESLPQTIVWWLAIGVLIVIVVRNFGSGATFRLPTRQAEPAGGRVASWMRVLHFARHDSYSRWRMAQRFALLAQEIIAQREGVDLRQARRLAEAGAGLPNDVAAYIRAGFVPHRPEKRVLVRLRTIGQHDPLALDPQLVATALEQLHLNRQ